MKLIIDASVAIKWFVAENMRNEARDLLFTDDELHAPDLFIQEISNVLWKKATRGEITPDQAHDAIIKCSGGIPALHHSVAYAPRAIKIALALNHPVYDCLYVACAEAIDGVIITADARFHRVIAASPFKARLRLLGEFA